MTLDTKRLEECMWIFFQFFNVDSTYKFHDIPLSELMPFVKKDITNLMLANEEQAQAVLWWMANAYHYIIGDTDDVPQVQFNFQV